MLYLFSEEEKINTKLDAWPSTTAEKTTAIDHLILDIVNGMS